MKEAKENDETYKQFVPKFDRSTKDDMYFDRPVEGENNRRIVVEKTKFDSHARSQQLKNPNHDVILLNLTHQKQRPMHKFPGFRILGAFPNLHAAAEHSRLYFPESKVSIFQTPAHQLVVISASHEDQMSVLHTKTQIETLVKMYAEAAKKRDDDFKHNTDQQRVGSVGDSIYSAKLKCMAAMATRGGEYDKSHVSDKVEHNPHNMSGIAQIAGQTHAVVMVLSDIRESVASGEAIAQPCIAILDVFGNEEDALAYAKTTATRQYPTSDIDVVDMYAWQFPDNIDPEKIKEVYGHKRLDDVMTARKENQELSFDFEKWCGENNYPATVVDV